MKKGILALTLIVAIACCSVSIDNSKIIKASIKKNMKLIVIDAGHQAKGNSNLEPIGPGASAKKAKVSSGTTGRASKLPEYKLNLIVAKKVAKELKLRGYKVKMIRTTHNVNISNSQRAKTANDLGADAFIRIHANGDANTSVSGALTMAPMTSNRYMSKKIIRKSQKLSKKIINAFCKTTKAKNRGVMQTNDMSGINWCKVPVTIIEMGYMSNRNDDLKMASKLYQAKMVKGIANGLDNYFNNK